MLSKTKLTAESHLIIDGCKPVGGFFVSHNTLPFFWPLYRGFYATWLFLLGISIRFLLFDRSQESADCPWGADSHSLTVSIAFFFYFITFIIVGMVVREFWVWEMFGFFAVRVILASKYTYIMIHGFVSFASTSSSSGISLIGNGITQIKCRWEAVLKFLITRYVLSSSEFVAG